MTECADAELLGFVAGCILLAASLPVVWEEATSIRTRSSGERLCRLAFAIGNGVWVVSGALSGHAAIIVMCGLNVLIHGGLWIIMTIRATKAESTW